MPRIRCYAPVPGHSQCNAAHLLLRCDRGPPHVRSFLHHRSVPRATAARQPAPGGGSVTALVGALASAIGEMDAQLQRRKKGLEAYEGELVPRWRNCTGPGDDAGADGGRPGGVRGLTAARKLPAERPGRRTAIAEALAAAIARPQAMGATAVAVLGRLRPGHQFRQLPPAQRPGRRRRPGDGDRPMRHLQRAGQPDRRHRPDERQAIESTTGQILSHAAALIQRVGPRIWGRYCAGSVRIRMKAEG